MSRLKKSARGTQAKPLAGRERIFQATVELICEGGPGAATARAICERCKVTTPTLYHYFGDLYQLYDEVLALMFVPEASAHPGREHTDPLGMIDYMWDCCVETARKRPGLYELKLQLVSMGRVPVPMKQFYTRLVRSFEALAQQRSMTTAPHTAAAMFWAAAIGTANIVTASKHGGPAYPKGAAEAHKKLILDTVLAQSAAARKTGSKSAAAVKRKRAVNATPLAGVNG